MTEEAGSSFLPWLEGISTMTISGRVVRASRNACGMSQNSPTSTDGVVAKMCRRLPRDSALESMTIVRSSEAMRASLTCLGG